MPDPIQFHDWFIVGENDTYRFCIARTDGQRWCGFAVPMRSPAERAFQSEGLDVSPQMVMILSEVAEGYQLGIQDRDKAILLTGAVAQDVESCYGGIERWFVPEDLRGDPDDFRCAHCDRVGCDGNDCRDAFEDYGGEDF